MNGPSAMNLPPPKPYSTKLAKAICAMTEARDADLTTIYRTAAPADRDRLLGERQERWRNDVLNGCAEAFEHAENLIETWKQMLEAIRQVQARERAIYPEAQA